MQGHCSLRRARFVLALPVAMALAASPLRASLHWDADASASGNNTAGQRTRTEPVCPPEGSN